MAPIKMMTRERLRGEDVKERVERRMAVIDALTPDQRRVVHEFGWMIVKTMLECGVSKPKFMRRIIHDVLHEFRTPE